MTLIPPELVDYILSLLDGEDRSTALLSCALASSEFYAIAIPALYSDIKIGCTPYLEALENAPRCSPPLSRLMKLASQLEHDPTPGSLVKSLHLRLEATDDSRFWRGLPNSSAEDLSIRPLATLLRSLTRLEAFRIEHCAVSRSFAFPNLEAVTAEVVRICNLPTLRTLALNLRGIPSRVWSRNTWLADRWKGLVPVSAPDLTTRSKGNITRLAYQQNSITDLVDLVKEAPWAFEGIRTVNLHIRSYPQRMTEPWEIGPFLRRTAATLEVLDWRIDLIEPQSLIGLGGDPINFSPIQDPFAGFPHLRRVSLSVKTRDTFEAGPIPDGIRDLFTYFQRNSEAIEELDLTLSCFGSATSCTDMWKMAERCLQGVGASLSSSRRMKTLNVRVIHALTYIGSESGSVDCSTAFKFNLSGIPSSISFSIACDCVHS
ncbi:hypothetical protein D9611_012127 [Ephemerocybe angulata]|uniref:F-box domain-containing protein n=1 Tax=Ephemerocybe angulata TaxID=980116 RepID=A0A8H5C5C4_9AGAR|nr:hypothetical protein D9611_012127 [Tulosesus angulatus]